MILLVMGVTGSGKTTVGKLLAQRLGWLFLDADDFHPAENIEKMKHGVPLTRRRSQAVAGCDSRGTAESVRRKIQDAVLACSALKQSYRESLASAVDLRICYLKGTYREIAVRLQSRTGHFAGEGILAGQFADLEEPRDALVATRQRTPEEIVGDVLRKLKLG